jgi:ABC-2 type transport system ATP-binding protein
VAAFSCDAELYLLDEPTSGLDPLMEMVFQECVAEVKKSGKTVFLSSHILSEVEALCDQVSIIRKGKIVESGTLPDLRHLTRTTVNVETETAFIRFLLPLGIKSITIEPPSLEELFMYHYDNGIREKEAQRNEV